LKFPVAGGKDFGGRRGSKEGENPIVGRLLGRQSYTERMFKKAKKREKKARSSYEDAMLEGWVPGEGGKKNHRKESGKINHP